MQVLGPLTISGPNEKRATMPSARVRGLAVALLLDAPQRISSERLISMLWDDPPASVSANIRNYLTSLRRALKQADSAPRDRLTTHRGAFGHPASYSLDLTDDDLDLAAFRALSGRGHTALAMGDFEQATQLLDQALRLWHGPAGADVHGSGHLARRLDALNEQRLMAQEQHIAARVARGETTTVICEIRNVLATHPLRERCWMYLLRTLYDVGDVAAALNAYRQAQGLFQEMLGVEPSAELGRAHLAILRRDDELLRRCTRYGSHAEELAAG